ncbi:MAG: VCBS repeat-containing protein, partial [Chitinophagales bacterium]
MFKPTHSIHAGLTACLWLPLSGQEAQAIYNTISPNIQKCLFADFTGDGTEDMMQYADNTFYLITATEPGEWQLERSFPAPGPAFLSLWTTADINNDGFTDMICKQTNDAFWFCAFLINPGTADGEWTYMADDHYMRYLIGFLDADSDGDVDMLYEDTGSSLHWVENDAGVFTIEHTMPDYYPATILSTIADFDQDGDMDLVIYFDDEGTYYYTNDGDGSFTVAELNSVEFEHGLWSGDFNNDGYADVIFQQGGHLQIAEFEPYTNSFNDAFDWIDMDPPDHFDVADLNGDGMKDWIFGFHDVFGYHVFYNLNNGIFFNPGDLEELPVFIEATPFYLMHDMQGDGKVDLVIHDSGYTYAYASAGAFLNQKQDVFDSHLPVELVSVFDVDGDDDMDIIALDEEGRFILMKYDIAGDVFNEIFVYPDVPDTPEPLYLTHADLDNDGDEDALAGFDYGDSFAGYYFLNNGSGSFTAFYFTDVSLQKIWFSDVDSDGDLDMLGIEREPENTIVLYQNSGETGALFSDPTTLLPPDPSYKNFSVDDENLDGLDDILFSKSGNTALYIMYNTGVAGYFNAPESLLTLICPGVNLLYTADIDNDMDLDILYTCPGGVTKISRNTDGVYINEAAGDFYGNLMDTPDYSDILDLNNDGTPDLIYGNDHINGGMYFKMSNGIGTYNADFIHYTGDHGQCVDQDGNGTIDFIGCRTAGVYTMRDIQS